MRAMRAVPILHSAPHSNRVPHVGAQDVSGCSRREVERGETHRDGRSKSSTHSAVLEATIRSGARTDFAESSRVFLPNSRKRYGPRPVAMLKHCRPFRENTGARIPMKRTLLVITTTIALAAMLPTSADAQRASGGGGAASSGGGAGGAAVGGGGGAATGAGGA